MAGFPKPQQPARQGESPYTPSTFQPLVAEEFQGLYTSTSRVGVKDEQLWWIDGYMPIGRMDLRTLPGLGPIIFTAPGALQIVFFDFSNIGATPYCILFLSDGSVYALNTATGSSSLIAAAGTISNPAPQNIGMTQSGNQYVLIITRQTNGYFIWDGTTFYAPGASFGGGTVPLAVGGNAIETYTGRVWIANGATITFSAPGSIIDFSSGSGGGNFTSTDSFLRVGFTALVQTNGFLYLIGDSSINYISGVQTSGSPPITTFTNQNADPEVGTPYAATVDVLGRNIVFANAWGAHVSYGSAVNKISDPLDGFYTSVPNFAGQQLSGAKAIIYSKRIWMALVPVIDLFTGQQRNKLLMWNGQIWFASEQDVVLSYIQHQEIASVITAWGTDGPNLRRLFQQPSTAFTKRFSSKFWPTPVGYQTTKTADRFWALAQYNVFDEPNVTLTVESEDASAPAQYTLTPTTQNSGVNWHTHSALAVAWHTHAGLPVVWSAISTGIVRFGRSVAQKGVVLGFTLETDCADMEWISAMIEPGDWSYDG